MRPLGKIIVLVILGGLFLLVATLRLLGVEGAIILGGMYCDICSASDIGALQRPLYAFLVQLGLAVRIFLCAGLWLL